MQIGGYLLFIKLDFCDFVVAWHLYCKADIYICLRGIKLCIKCGNVHIANKSLLKISIPRKWRDDVLILCLQWQGNPDSSIFALLLDLMLECDFEDSFFGQGFWRDVICAIGWAKRG